MANAILNFHFDFLTTSLMSYLSLVNRDVDNILTEMFKHFLSHVLVTEMFNWGKKFLFSRINSFALEDVSGR